MENQDLEQRLHLLLNNYSRPKPGDRIAVKNGGRVRFIRTSTIDWIEAADNYVCLHCGSETICMRETMQALETKLDSSRFVRIHRSAIVNIDRIKEMQPWFRGDSRIVLQDGTQLAMSRTYRGRLKAVLLPGMAVK